MAAFVLIISIITSTLPAKMAAEPITSQTHYCNLNPSSSKCFILVTCYHFNYRKKCKPHSSNQLEVSFLAYLDGEQRNEIKP